MQWRMTEKQKRDVGIIEVEENKIFENLMEIIEAEELEYKLLENNEENIYLVDIDGNDLKSEEDVWEIFYKKLKLKEKPISWDWFYFNMTEENEIDDKLEVMIVLRNYKEILKDSIKDRKEFLDLLYVEILPFWEEKVLKVLKNGKRRKISIYLTK